MKMRFDGYQEAESILRIGSVAVCLTLSMFAFSQSVMAATTGLPAGIMVNKEKHLVWQTNAPRHIVSPTIRDKSLKTIWSNLGDLYPKGIYVGSLGEQSCASQDCGGLYWPAVGFTPSSDSTLKEIDIPVGNVFGPDSAIVGLYNDNGGAPGTLIKKWKVQVTDFAGDCCGLVVVKARSGIPVSAGTQYWIALMTAKDEPEAFNSWNANSTDDVDPEPHAYYTADKGWQPTPTALPENAFGVFGK